MFKVFVFSLLFGFSAFGYQYRHVEPDRVKSGSYYFGIGLGVPITNKSSDISSFKIQLTNETVIGNIIEQNNINYRTGSMGFNSSRIAGSAFVGYKFPYYFRTDLKVDFTTFSEDYKVLGQNVPEIGNITTPRILKYTVRQFALIGNVFLDLDNSTPFTPYVGAGSGVAFTSTVFTLSQITPGGESYEEPDVSIFSNPRLVYELKAGILIGSRKMFVDLEYNFRNTPGLKLKSSGVTAKIAFRI